MSKKHEHKEEGNCKTILASLHSAKSKKQRGKYLGQAARHRCFKKGKGKKKHKKEEAEEEDEKEE
jgi:hypothetical protein